MATRLKTVEYWFPTLASVSDLTDTNFTQITVYLPESSKNFVSVALEVFVHDNDTSVSGGGNVNRRQISLQLGAAGYSVVNNTNVLTTSGEAMMAFASADFTSYFNTNWSGSSMTCDARLLVDGASAGVTWVAASAKLTITYEYDDTSSTFVKTVFIPLNAPVGAMGTSKPGSPVDTIPNLSTFLPEASVTIRQTAIIVQGNSHMTTTGDAVLNMQIDSGASVSQALEGGPTTAFWYRYAWVDPSFTTNATHSFYIWSATTARLNHQQVWMVVTYEFDPASTTTVLNSLLLPVEVSSPMGGPTSSDQQLATRELFIEEPATITIRQSAVLVFFDHAAAITGINVKCGGGSYTAYTNAAAVLGGGDGLMRRCESDITLARGRNTLTLGIYRTDTSDLGQNVSALWMINYTSGKASAGIGAHNHTVKKLLAGVETGAAAADRTISATSFGIPESSYFINSIGVHYQYVSNGTGTPSGVSIQVERLSSGGEGGVAWDSAYADVSRTDPEVGLRQCWATVRSIFKRWPGDDFGDRIDVETARRWRLLLANGCASFDHLSMYITYHSIMFTISGTISGSGGGTVNVDLLRKNTGEKVLATSRSGNGSYSFTWYDDTETMYCRAREDSTHVGSSDDGVAS